MRSFVHEKAKSKGDGGQTVIRAQSAVGKSDLALRWTWKPGRVMGPNLKAETLGTPLDRGRTSACQGPAPEGVSHSFNKRGRLIGSRADLQCHI